MNDQILYNWCLFRSKFDWVLDIGKCIHEPRKNVIKYLDEFECLVSSATPSLELSSSLESQALSEIPNLTTFWWICPWEIIPAKMSVAVQKLHPSQILSLLLCQRFWSWSSSSIPYQVSAPHCIHNLKLYFEKPPIAGPFCHLNYKVLSFAWYLTSRFQEWREIRFVFFCCNLHWKDLPSLEFFHITKYERRWFLKLTTLRNQFNYFKFFLCMSPSFPIMTCSSQLRN